MDNSISTFDLNRSHLWVMRNGYDPTCPHIFSYPKFIEKFYAAFCLILVTRSNIPSPKKNCLFTVYRIILITNVDKIEYAIWIYILAEQDIWNFCLIKIHSFYGAIWCKPIPNENSTYNHNYYKYNRHF